MRAVQLLGENLAGVVLAGGRNSRLRGLDKGQLSYRGVPLAVRAVVLLADIFEEVVLVTNSTQGYPGLPDGTLQTADLLPGRGPLSGIHAGLSRCSGEAAFCVACDMPFLDPELIREQVRLYRQQDCEVLLPRLLGRIEPLHAIYRRSLLPDVERLLSDGEGYAIRRLFETARTAYLDLEDKPEIRAVFTNINTPEDLDRLCAP